MKSFLALLLTASATVIVNAQHDMSTMGATTITYATTEARVQNLTAAGVSPQL